MPICNFFDLIKLTIFCYLKTFICFWSLLILEQASKKLGNMSRHFERLGSLGFWWQLVCTVVAAVILSFSTVVTGNIKSPVTFYTTAFSVAAAFISVFWSFGYIRLSERLRRTANEPSKVNPSLSRSLSLRVNMPINKLVVI